MIKRSRRVAYISHELLTQNEYVRLGGFTEFSMDYNPKEYTRKYIDEDMERTSVTGYQPTISYKFDYCKGEESQLPFIEVFERGAVGDLAKCKIAIADLEAEDSGKYIGKMREFIIIPSREGDDTDVYTFSGTLKADSETKLGYCTMIGNDAKKMKFTEAVFEE